MIQNGFIGESMKLKSICESVNIYADTTDEDLFRDDDELEIDSVLITLPSSLSDSYSKEEKPTTVVDMKQNVSGAPIGSAGNSLDKTVVEPQMGSVEDELDNEQIPLTDSLGGIGKMNLSESSQGMVSDENPMKTAKQTHSENSMDKVREFFDSFAFKPKSNVKYDMDVTAPKIEVSKEPLRRIPRGW